MKERLVELAEQVANGTLVPYLGPGVLQDVREQGGDAAIPADSDSLILAMNQGRPMAPKLMYEFPRAAMNIEHKRGRPAVNRFLTETYATRQWSRAALHDWLQSIAPRYVIDINRDTQLQDSFAGQPHLLLRGTARIGGGDYRYRIDHYDGRSYREIPQEQVDPTLPLLFKPLGTPLPDPIFIASDADFVDYITELMGGFAIPPFLKKSRQGRQYLFLGIRFNRDTERMVMSEIIHAAGEPAGWALIAEPTAKERRFLARMQIEIIEADVADLLAAVEEVAAEAVGA